MTWLIMDKGEKSFMFCLFYILTNKIIYDGSNHNFHSCVLSPYINQSSWLCPFHVTDRYHIFSTPLFSLLVHFFFSVYYYVH